MVPRTRTRSMYAPPSFPPPLPLSAGQEWGSRGSRLGEDETSRSCAWLKLDLLTRPRSQTPTLDHCPSRPDLTATHLVLPIPHTATPRSPMLDCPSSSGTTTPTTPHRTTSANTAPHRPSFRASATLSCPVGSTSSSSPSPCPSSRTLPTGGRLPTLSFRSSPSCPSRRSSEMRPSSALSVSARPSAAVRLNSL